MLERDRARARCGASRDTGTSSRPTILTSASARRRPEPPEGFEDAIGWMMPMTGERFPDDLPPHWNVTFAVDDADAIAERAAELHGRIVVPPFDVPYVRIAVLSDPQGAVFSINKFVPG